MKKASIVALVVSLLLVMTISAIHVNAQTSGNWIVRYTITDLRTGQILQDVVPASGSSGAAPILAGSELRIAITIQVTASNPSTSLRLSTNLEHSTQSNFWELPTDDYPGISRQTYNPNQQSITFNQTIGTLVIYCYGIIPAGVTQSQAGNSGITLDKQINKDIVTLTDPANTKLDAINVNIVDAKINEFATRLAAAQAEIQSMSDRGVDQSYIALSQSVVDGATSLASAGLVDVGINTLNQLAAVQNQNSPGSTNTPIEATLFIPAVIVLIVVAALMGFMFMRANGKVSYNKLVIEDQIKDLEGLTLRAAKMDRNMAANLNGVADRLKNLVEV